MARRVRFLNTSFQTTAYPQQPATPPQVTASWDLETDWTHQFAKKFPTNEMPFSVIVPQPKPISIGWAHVMTEHRFIRPRLVPTMPFTAWQPPPFVYATTSAAQTTGNTTLIFVSVPAAVTVGMAVYDLTTVCIPAATTVLSKTPTTVTLSAALTATCNSGDRIFFTYG